MAYSDVAALATDQDFAVRTAAAYATDTAVDIVTRVFRASGGGALYRTGILQRCLRDIHAGGQHFMVNDSAYERLGQILLGVLDVDPMG